MEEEVKRPQGRQKGFKPVHKKRLRTVNGIIKDDKIWKIFEHACHLQCDKHEISCLLEITCENLERACTERYDKCFNEVWEYYSQGGKMMLRRYQLDLAKKNATMAIWLGKQWLKQKDQPDELSQFNGKLGELLDVLKDKKPEIEIEED